MRARSHPAIIVAAAILSRDSLPSRGIARSEELVSFSVSLSLSSPPRGQGSLREGKRGKGNSRPSEFLPDPPGRWPGTRPIIKTRLAAATAPCFNKSVYTAPCPFRPSRGGPARARTFAACTHARATRGPRSQRGATCNYLYCRSLRFPPRPAPLLRKASRIADSSIRRLSISCRCVRAKPGLHVPRLRSPRRTRGGARGGSAGPGFRYRPAWTGNAAGVARGR